MLALRHLGDRTGAYFAIAPFFGAVLTSAWRTNR
jgi:hypothetical protein